MQEPVELPPLPEIAKPSGPGRWADHVARYDGMSNDERAHWFSGLSTAQQTEFKQALDAERAVRKANRPAGYALIVAGVLVGFLFNLWLGGFLVLAGIGYNLIGKK